MDDGGIIKIPKGHVWIECENEKERSIDSLSEEIGGPISKKFVLGPCVKIIWPLWRWESFQDMEKFKRLMIQGDSRHSRVYTNEEIYHKYGIM